ncbi:hypothetical protein C8J57DRAFT_1614910 [Mycena rebaudengoi]|nr:hypothetical protein C8J57DRAFT_1614910 [Mycena rebaudengoi]
MVVIMSEKTQIGWNGLSRIVGFGGIATGPKPLAVWLVTSLETFKVSQGAYHLEMDLHGLVAFHHIEYLARCPEYGAQQHAMCNMFKHDEGGSGTPFADGTIIRLDHGEIKSDFLRKMTTENQFELTVLQATKDFSDKNGTRTKKHTSPKQRRFPRRESPSGGAAAGLRVGSGVSENGRSVNSRAKCCAIDRGTHGACRRRVPRAFGRDQRQRAWGEARASTSRTRDPDFLTGSQGECSVRASGNQRQRAGGEARARTGNPDFLTRSQGECSVRRSGSGGFA